MRAPTVTAAARAFRVADFGPSAISDPSTTLNPTTTLLPNDIEMHTKLGIPFELLVEAQIVRVTDREARGRYGIITDAYRNCSGIFYPYLCPITGKRTTGRLRRDDPEIDADGKQVAKYLSPYGDNRHFYFPPGAGLLVADPSTRIVLVEAEKSVLALTGWAARRGVKLLPIGMGGCWSWLRSDRRSGREGKSEPLADLHYCDGRRVYILLDNNTATNPKVQAAQTYLVRELQKLERRCRPRICNLPATPGVNGPDDYIAIRGDDAMAAVLNNVHRRRNYA